VEASAAITATQKAAESARRTEMEKKRLRESCKEFESIMVAYMMKTMRESSMRAEEPENARQMYEEMLAGHVSKEVSKGSVLGLGDMLYSSLQAQVKARPSKADGAAQAGAAEAALQASAQKRLPQLLSESGMQQFGLKPKGVFTE